MRTAEGNLERWRAEMGAAREALATTENTLAQENEKLPIVEEAFRASNNRRHEVQQALSQAEQALQVEQTKLGHAARVLEQLGQREDRLREEQGGLAVPDQAGLERVEADARALEQTLNEEREVLARNEAALPELEQTLRERLERCDAVNQQVTELTARLAALTQLQERIARGAELKDWLSARGLASAPRLWQGISIEPGWEDALESVLRERLNALALDDVDRAADWSVDAPPAKLSLVERTTATQSPNASSPEGMEPLERFVTCRDARLAPVLQDWLHQVFVVADAASGMALRRTLPAGAMLVTRQGHIYTRHSVSLHAPDSELHGVLSRQREIEALEERAAVERNVLAAGQAQVADAERAIEAHRSALTLSRQTVADAQQRHHALQMEALRLSEQAQRLKARAGQIASELVEIEEQKRVESEHRAQADANRERLEHETAQTRGQLDAATELYGRADAVMRKQREVLDEARRAHQEAVYQARSAEEKVRDVEESIRTLTEQSAVLASTLASEEKALAECDEGPWQAQLQDALKLRGEREQALAAARDALGCDRDAVEGSGAGALRSRTAARPAAGARERDSPERAGSAPYRRAVRAAARRVRRGRSRAPGDAREGHAVRRHAGGDRPPERGDPVVRRGKPRRARGAAGGPGTQDVSRRAVAGSPRSDGDARRRDSPHRSRNTRAPANDLRRSQRAFRQNVSGALRRRHARSSC